MHDLALPASHTPRQHPLLRLKTAVGLVICALGVLALLSMI